MTVQWREVSETRIQRVPGAGAWPASVPAGFAGRAEIEAVARRISGHVVTTPVCELEVAGRRCVAKLESLQNTGSFKIRGAAHRMLTLSDRERAGGVVTASSGNHGIAVARLAGELGVRAVVCVPRGTDPVKLEAIRSAGAEVRDDGQDFDSSARRAAALSVQLGLVLIHPFDDLQVIAGHATVGLELAAQVPQAAAVLVPLSGGGLASGVACALRATLPDTRLIGVSPVHAPVMYRSLLAGRPLRVDERPTLAGALSGGLGNPNRYSFALVSTLLDEVWLVSEQELAAAMIWGADALGSPVEGAGAAALAGLAQAHERGGPVVAVVSGGNVDTDTVEHARRVAAGMATPTITHQTQPVHH